MLICYYTPYRQDCTRLCAGKLIAVSHNCTVMLGVILWTFDNLLWPEASNVPHTHLPRVASLNSKSFEEVHIVQLCDCQSSRWSQKLLEFSCKGTGKRELCGFYVKVSRRRLFLSSVIIESFFFFFGHYEMV